MQFDIYDACQVNQGFDIIFPNIQDHTPADFMLLKRMLGHNILCPTSVEDYLS